MQWQARGGTVCEPLACALHGAQVHGRLAMRPVALLDFCLVEGVARLADAVEEGLLLGRHDQLVDGV